MEDIISHGDERPPRTGRRRLLAAAALVAVAALLTARFLPRDHPHARPAHAVRVRLLPRLSALPPSGITGGTAAWAPDARLPRSGARPDWFWPAGGRVAPILGLPSDRDGYVFTRLSGGWAIQADPGGPVFSLGDRARRAVRVGTASLVAPAPGRGQMWLTTFPAGRGRAPGVAPLYSASGARIGAPVTLPAGYEITQGTRHGLLLGSLSLAGQGTSDELWDPAAGTVLRRFDGVVAVTATAVAYAPPCTRTCPVDVVSLASGHQVTIRIRPTDTATSGVFSPDGRFLALQIDRGNGEVSDDGTAATQLEVASAATGHAIVVPRIFVSSSALAAFGWPGSQDDLVVEFTLDGKAQVASWNPVARSNLALANVTPAEDPAALVVG